MMKPIISIAVILLSVTFSAHAFTPADSIGVYRDNNNIYILHEVTRGETLYSLSKKYNVRVDLIISSNPAIKDFSIAEGQIVKVPVEAIAKTENKTPVIVQQKEEPRQVNSNNGVVRHQIQSGETLSAIAGRYKVRMADIAAWNNLQTFDDIRAGQILIIKNQPENVANIYTPETVKEQPKVERREQVYTPEPVVEKKPEPIVTKKENPSAKTNKNSISHTVELGETLYSLSKRYDVRVSDIANWNNLTNLEIKVGQTLVIKSDNASSSNIVLADNSREKEKNTMEFEEYNEPVKVKPEYKPEIDVRRENNYSLKYKEDASSMYYKEKAESGIATWIKDASPQATKNGYFALHKTLPVGTIVKVKNPMNGRIVYAKVIGNLPDNQDNRNILIKLPESAAREMAILDDRMNVDVIFLNRAKEN